MRLIHCPLFVLLAAVTLPAAAKPLSYTHADARAVWIKLDAADARGLTLSGSLRLAESFFLAAAYGGADTDDFTVDGVRGASESRSLSLGGGLRHSLGTNLDLAGTVTAVNVRAKGSGGFAGSSESDTGFALGAALRFGTLWTPALEAAIGVGYLRVFDETDTSLNGELLYHFTPRVAAAAGTSLTSDATSFSLGLRVDLDRAP